MFLFRRDLELAVGSFRLAGAARPNDVAAALLEAGVAVLCDDPPPDDWDGTYQATSD